MNSLLEETIAEKIITDNPGPHFISRSLFPALNYLLNNHGFTITIIGISGPTLTITIAQMDTEEERLQ